MFNRLRAGPITVALLGAGNRGADVYADYILRHPKEALLVAAADPNRERLEQLRLRHNLKKKQLYGDWRKLLAQPKLADLLIIATPDQVHVDPALAGLDKGYHLLLEKPIAPSEEELERLVAATRNAATTVTVAHVLRYTPFFRTIKDLLLEGRLGRLVGVDHLENIGYWHFAHSYVRGNWRNMEVGSPLILAKSCHDLDILRWLIDVPCRRLSSFGDLTYFRPDNAPPGAASRCLDCPVERDCAYSAVRYYVETCRDVHGWPVSVVTSDTSLEGRIEALRDGPYGRCVYASDNDVVDHQVVSMEFAGGVTATLTVCAFTGENTRTVKLMGSRGELRGHLDKGEIELRDFLTGQETLVHVPTGGGHAGGDAAMMEELLKHLQALRKDGSVAGGMSTALESSLESHFLAFAAERSRLEGRLVDLGGDSVTK